MAIPDFQSLMKPVLQSVLIEEKNTDKVVIDLIKYFKISPEEVLQKHPSGRDTVLRNRTQWAFKYMFEAKLLDRPARGFYKTTERGKKLLESNKVIDKSVLEEFTEFNEWLYSQTKPKEEKKQIIATKELLTPEERLRVSYEELRNITKRDLLNKVLQCSPIFFENLVLELVVAMGYGSSLEEAASTTKKTGDGGIDGLINQDKLGLDKIYIQAKRWRDGKVTESTVRNFVGAMDSHAYVSKGIIITTSQFTEDAKIYKEKTKTKRVEFIDGDKLTEFMMEFEIGVQSVENLKKFKIDEDYFIEE